MSQLIRDLACLKVLHFDAAGVELPEPKWNKLFIKGEFARRDFPGGKVEIGTAQFQQMIDNWKRMGSQALPIDRFHWGDSNNTDIAADDKDAVGFIEDLRIDANGDLEGLTRWNDLGLEKLRKDRLRYFSPSFRPDAVDRRTGKNQGFTLYGGGLLNDPFLSELPRLAASAHVFEARRTTPETPSMNKILLAALAALGITMDADATDEAALERIKKFGEERTAAEAAKTKLAAQEQEKALKLARDAAESSKTLAEQLATERAAREVLAKEVEKIQLSSKNGEIDQLVGELRTARKIIAAEADDVKKIALAMGVPYAKTFFGARKPVVPAFGEVGVPGDPEADVDNSPAAATKKLELAAEEILKKSPKMSEADAFLAAIEQNPKIALAAQPPAIRIASVAK